MPIKSELIETSSLTYQRRLVRVLNSQEAGFYTNGHRYIRARLSKGQLQVKIPYSRWESMGYEQFFSDGYGRQLVASRMKLD